ncbi:Shikimate 5-dehydrogenase I alpha [Legionella pneumophila subsp. pneumophila LPE509]|nr:Shikimate 5-dehydrogenase I alpha [Legionella pneumophila subsp. pneumophila LPE509]
MQLDDLSLQNDEAQKLLYPIGFIGFPNYKLFSRNKHINPSCS